MKGSLETGQETGKEYGFQTTAIKEAITMKVSIKMIKKVDLEFIDGKTGQFMRESFRMT